MSNQLFTIDASTDKHIDAKLLYIAKSKIGADWHSTVHSHYFTECFYVLKGRGMFTIEKEDFYVEESDLIVVNPGISHTEKFAGDRQFEYIVLGIDGISFKFSGDTGGNDYSIFHYRKDRENIEFCLNMLLSEVEKDLEYHDTVCQNILELTVIQLLRRTNSSMSAVDAKSVNRACRVAKRYIDENFRNPISLDELATVAKVNKYYLSHAFAVDYKVSPINYLISKRIDECKNLLVSTTYSISQIAGFTGFSSPSYFSQCFKRNTGMQPEVYRKRFRSSHNEINV